MVQASQFFPGVHLHLVCLAFPKAYTRYNFFYLNIINFDLHLLFFQAVPLILVHQLDQDHHRFQGDPVVIKVYFFY